MSTHTGIVSFFGKRGFGFIVDDESQISYYTHISQTGNRVLKSGDCVSFEIGEDIRRKGGEMAVNVVKIDNRTPEKENFNGKPITQL